VGAINITFIILPSEPNIRLVVVCPHLSDIPVSLLDEESILLFYKVKAFD